jgi:hypothetical protein
MNNMDIRCGELQSVMVNLNYWIQVWSEWNDDKEIEWKEGENQEAIKEAFHAELNTAMTLAYEKNYYGEDKYIIMDNLVQTYINNGWLKIIEEEEEECIWLPEGCIKCKECGTTLPSCCSNEHLDINNSINKCPNHYRT